MKSTGTLAPPVSGNAATGRIEVVSQAAEVLDQSAIRVAEGSVPPFVMLLEPWK
jgi:hypothetical protein